MSDLLAEDGDGISAAAVTHIGNIGAGAGTLATGHLGPGPRGPGVRMRSDFIRFRSHGELRGRDITIRFRHHFRGHSHIASALFGVSGHP